MFGIGVAKSLDASDCCSCGWRVRLAARREVRGARFGGGTQEPAGRKRGRTVGRWDGAAAGAGRILLRPADPCDPFREMRSLQAEMNEMLRPSIARFHASPLMNPFGDDAGYSL